METQEKAERRLRTLKRALAAPDTTRLQRTLETLRPQEIAHHWSELDPSHQRRVVTELPVPEAAQVVADLPADSLTDFLLEQLSDSEIGRVLDALDPDDLADVLQVVQEQDPERTRKIVAGLRPYARAAARALTRYEPEAAGGLMTPEFISLRASRTVEEALERLRREHPDAETIYYVFVEDDAGRLGGVLSLRQLVVSPPSTAIGGIMNPDVIHVRTDTDQEEVAQRMADYDLPVLPVVDPDDRLVGIVTVDDVLDVLELEATEDIHRLGAAPVDVDYARARPWLLFRKRIPWLVLLVVSMTLTFNVISHYEDVIAEVVILAAFIPLLIGTGGNVGAQVATLVVRALGTRELESGDYTSVLRKEIWTGLLMGLAFGIFIAGYVLFFQPDPLIALALGITMVLITLTANLVGASLPFVFRRLDIDPALTSSPGITTVMDVAGLLIYFHVVIWILGL